MVEEYRILPLRPCRNRPTFSPAVMGGISNDLLLVWSKGHGKFDGFAISFFKSIYGG
jgi:hypothetical protein